MFTDTDTPSGDASILRERGGVDSVLNSTEIACGEAHRPNRNISVIPSQVSQPIQSNESTAAEGNLSSGGPTNDSAPSTNSVTRGTTSSSVSCSLCGMEVRGQAYLSQHLNKKKCLERQRKQKECLPWGYLM